MTENLIEAIQSECNRVRRIIPLYDELGPTGQFGKCMLQQTVLGGESAIASGDVVKMIAALESLRDCSE